MSYFHTLLAEVCTGVAPEVNARALAWGKQYEDDARALFEFTVGVQVCFLHHRRDRYSRAIPFNIQSKQ